MNAFTFLQYVHILVHPKILVMCWLPLRIPTKINEPYNETLTKNMLKFMWKTLWNFAINSSKFKYQHIGG